MRPDEIKILSKVPWKRLWGVLDDFWRDTYVAEVNSKPITVKMYHDRCGGEKAFLRDVKLFGRNVWVNFYLDISGTD